jgi:hypothetical protein
MPAQSNCVRIKHINSGNKEVKFMGAKVQLPAGSSFSTWLGVDGVGNCSLEGSEIECLASC